MRKDPAHAINMSMENIFITNPTNIRYLTGFVGVAPEEREAYVLETPTTTYLFTNALYVEDARSLPNVTVVQISRENPISKELERITSEQKIRELGFEDTNLTVAELANLKVVLTTVKLIPTRNQIENRRMVKRKDEIEHIKLAAKITDQCFSFILKRIRPGITESRLAWEIESFFKVRAGGNAFSPIVAFNEHSSQPHYMSHGNNPLRNNSLILLDFGARVSGYCADMTRVVFLGTPKPEWAKAYEVILAANEKVIAMLNNGERHGATLDAAAKEIIAEADLPPYPHSLGHAVGLDIHEAPRLSTHADEILKSDMAVTIEPGVYIEGQYGIRIEDLVILKQKSIEIVSKSPKNLMVI
jgi:Xaa-Pro aminopeptidase